MAVDGSIGVDATLSLNEVSLTVGADTVASSGEMVAQADGDRAGFGWELNVAGPIERSDCFLTSFEPSNGSVSLFAFADTSTKDTRASLDLTFDDVQKDPSTGKLTSVDLDGRVEIDGSAALTFRGTLDDADGNGIPGDSLTIVFANGESTTLEAFIEDRLAGTPAAIARLLSRFR